LSAASEIRKTYLVLAEKQAMRDVLLNATGWLTVIMAVSGLA
jgi:hypothetical protein